MRPRDLVLAALVHGSFPGTHTDLTAGPDRSGARPPGHIEASPGIHPLKV